MSHLSWDEVWAYVDGESSDGLRTENHLRTCRTCSERLHTAKEAHRGLVDTLSLAVPKPSEENTARLRAAVSGPSSIAAMRSRRPNRRRALLTSTVSAVAAVLVVGVIGSHILHGPAGSSHGPSAGAAGSVDSAVGSAAASTTAAVNGPTSAVASSTYQSAGAGESVSGTAQVTVTNDKGAPLSGADVAFMGNGQVLTHVRTNAAGQTAKVALSVPVDPMLAGSFDPRKGYPPQGVITTVVWKQGYQPVVSYDTQVFAGGGPYQPNLMLAPASDAKPVNVTGQGVDGAGHVLDVGNFAQWAQAQLLEGGVTVPVPQGPPTDLANVQVTATDPNENPVSGATVALVAGGQILGTAKTDASGQATIVTTGGVLDWRSIYTGSSQQPTTVAALVAVKNGFVPSVGFYQPLVRGQTQNVPVRMETVQWRQAQGQTTNTDAPTTISGAIGATAQDALRVVAVAKQSTVVK